MFVFLSPLYLVIASFEKLTVMVNCRRQFGWVTVCPDMWSNIILDVSVRVFWNKIDI